ncbi:hypothetical protein CBR_g3743 [Chara braunii]|uniref:Uncharacterized protein n=1 Tax=Chara braunii TaxID=69332 RepID=A0A388KG70_CHABU|nr:hypothetical protein CBR_g3743 [Chara braunii]|eukprot:GBG69045.1 hypothetical protein CBR_g3743 [Chara braunii]
MEDNRKGASGGGWDDRRSASPHLRPVRSPPSEQSLKAKEEVGKGIVDEDAQRRQQNGSGTEPTESYDGKRIDEDSLTALYYNERRPHPHPHERGRDKERLKERAGGGKPRGKRGKKLDIGGERTPPTESGSESESDSGTETDSDSESGSGSESDEVSDVRSMMGKGKEPFPSLPSLAGTQGRAGATVGAANQGTMPVVVQRREETAKNGTQDDPSGGIRHRTREQQGKGESGEASDSGSSNSASSSSGSGSSSEDDEDAERRRAHDNSEDADDEGEGEEEEDSPQSRSMTLSPLSKGKEKIEEQPRKRKRSVRSNYTSSGEDEVPIVIGGLLPHHQHHHHHHHHHHPYHRKRSPASMPPASKRRQKPSS